MSSISQEELTLSRPSGKERLKVVRACQSCRTSKLKCDGGRPACHRCHGNGKICDYSRGKQDASPKTQIGTSKPRRRLKPIIYRNTTPFRVNSPAHSASKTPAPPAEVYGLRTPASADTPSASELSRGERIEKTRTQEPIRTYYTAHGRFAGQVASDIDMTAGHATTNPNLVPFVDAPLFGDVGEQPLRNVLDFATELSPGYADHLISIYWQHVHPVEPILDRQKFFPDYDAYRRSVALTHSDRDTWLSSLNLVFALAVQVQETIPLQKRNDESNRYFQKAWALLRPEAIMWHQGSLELVQCLMLMNRYLHCTNNQQKSWMTAGLAIRIAQNLCSNTPGMTSSSDGDRDLRQRVWASCVALERCSSWALGKSSTPTVMPLPTRTPLLANGSAGSRTRELELHEFGSQIQIAQTQSRNPLAAKLGLPRLYQNDDYHAIALQIDSCIHAWEDRLPEDWKIENIHPIGDLNEKRERYLLHFRLLHTKIYLYRPMLARVYSKKSNPAPPQHSNKSSTLSDRLLRECARLCLEAAQDLTSLVVNIHRPNESISILPWWYRIYYLHMTGTHFLAAIFEADLFTASVEQSWRQVLAALREHEHLSLYIQQCIRTFEDLSAKIRHKNSSNTAGYSTASPEDTPSFFLDDIFHDMDFDFDEFLVGVENSTEGKN